MADTTTAQPMTKPATAQLGFEFSSGDRSPAPPAARPERNKDRDQTEARPSKRSRGGKSTSAGPVTAEHMATQQREISVSEFFAKNRHLLGFDNKRKALLTTVKEAVDNSLDACEEARILPELVVEVTQTAEERFRVMVQDNGPGIVKEQIPNIFGKLLYGSKFHRLKMCRGQQGIGISAAGMYGLITTGKPLSVVSRTSSKAKAHHYKLAIDTKKNRPDIVHDEAIDVDFPHGTRVEIDLVASYVKGRQGVDEYIDQTAIANPHAEIRYVNPTGERLTFHRGVKELPPETKEIKPHPHGIELGVLMKMLKETECQKVGGFLQKEFSRVTSSTCKSVCKTTGITPLTWVKQIDSQTAERIYDALQKSRIMAPSTDCLAPVGTQQILAGLLKGVKAEFYTAATRAPTVYRGNPFQMEVGFAYGGELPTEETARLIRFANRVPLLYQQSHCSIYKAVADTNWRAYGLSQSAGSLPAGPLVIMVHFASVWVPFTSESKEAVADYDEIRKEIRLGLQECGRKLQTFINRRKRTEREGERRSVFVRYIPEVSNALNAITGAGVKKLRDQLMALARERTELADRELDDQGRFIRKSKKRDPLEDDSTVIVERDPGGPEAGAELFGDDESRMTGKVVPRKKGRRK